jgi:hypothetical protein
MAHPLKEVDRDLIMQELEAADVRHYLSDVRERRVPERRFYRSI